MRYNKLPESKAQSVRLLRLEGKGKTEISKLTGVSLRSVYRILESVDGPVFKDNSRNGFFNVDLDKRTWLI